MANDGEGPYTWLARRERVKLTAQNGNGMGMPLTIAVQLLPTAGDGSRWGEYAAAIARHEQAFGRPAPEPTEAKPAPRPTMNRHGNQRSDQTGQRLSASFVEWMMMLPAGWVTDVPGVTRNQALKALGNGVCPPQCVAALRIMLDRIEAAA